MRTLLIFLDVVLLLAVGSGVAWLIVDPPGDVDGDNIGSGRKVITRIPPGDDIAGPPNVFLAALRDLRVAKVKIDAPADPGDDTDINIEDTPAVDVEGVLLRELQQLIVVHVAFYSTVPENCSATIQLLQTEGKPRYVFKPGDWLFENEETGEPTDGEVLAIERETAPDSKEMAELRDLAKRLNIITADAADRDVEMGVVVLRYKKRELRFPFKIVPPKVPAKLADIAEESLSIEDPQVNAGAPGAQRPVDEAGRSFPMPVGTPGLPGDWDGVETRALDQSGDHWAVGKQEIQSYNEESLLAGVSVDSDYDKQGRPRGLKARRIPENHVAYKRGFRTGDVIKSINGVPVTNIPEARKVVQKQSQKGVKAFVVVYVRRGKQGTKTFRVK